MHISSGFPCGSAGKESAYNEGDLGSIPGWGRSPGEGKGYSLQYSGLWNSMDRGAWQATVHGGHRDLYTTEQLTLSLSRNLRKNHRAICGPSGNQGPQRELYFYTTVWCRKHHNLSQPLLWQATIWDYLTPRAFLQDPQWEMEYNISVRFLEKPRGGRPYSISLFLFFFIFSPPHIILTAFYPNRCRIPTSDSSDFFCHESLRAETFENNNLFLLLPLNSFHKHWLLHGLFTGMQLDWRQEHRVTRNSSRRHHSIFQSRTSYTGSSSKYSDCNREDLLLLCCFC